MIDLRVVTHSGTEDIVSTEKYDAADLETKINDDSIQVIALGGNIYSRIDIKLIKPVDNDSTMM